ncbi:MAG: DUF2344 domain-containing protein [Lachnospiraceae bacterium]|nr:DUF2344 domain-containing protein [Lachnospiraceae bacterium]
MKVRIKFSKQGSLRFIGHLDVMRYFQKLNRRAALDLTYTKGFSPHQEMSFAAPLGLGLTSDGEYADIEFESLPGSSEELVKRMNEVSVPELQVIDAVLLPDQAKNAMSILAGADYELSFREGYEPEDPEGFFKALEDYLSRETIPVTKNTKTGTQDVDLKVQIREWRRLPGNRLFFKVDTGSRSNLKPEFIMECFYESLGREYDPLTFEVNRTEMYGEIDRKLVPLYAYGRRF